MENNKIVLFESKDGEVRLPVIVDADKGLWLTRKRLEQLGQVALVMNFLDSPHDEGGGA